MLTGQKTPRSLHVTNLLPPLRRLGWPLLQIPKHLSQPFLQHLSLTSSNHFLSQIHLSFAQVRSIINFHSLFRTFLPTFTSRLLLHLRCPFPTLAYDVIIDPLPTSRASNSSNTKARRFYLSVQLLASCWIRIHIAYPAFHPLQTSEWDRS